MSRKEAIAGERAIYRENERELAREMKKEKDTRRY